MEFKHWEANFWPSMHVLLIIFSGGRIWEGGCWFLFVLPAREQRVRVLPLVILRMSRMQRVTA